MLGLSERLLQRVKFRLHGPARKGRQLVAQTLGRNMGAMRSGNGVIHVQIAQRCHSLAQSRIILFIACVQASIFEHSDLAIVTRSYTRSVGKEWVTTCQYRGGP